MARPQSEACSTIDDYEDKTILDQLKELQKELEELKRQQQEIEVAKPHKYYFSVDPSYVAKVNRDLIIELQEAHNALQKEVNKLLEK